MQSNDLHGIPPQLCSICTRELCICFSRAVLYLATMLQVSTADAQSDRHSRPFAHAMS